MLQKWLQNKHTKAIGAIDTSMQAFDRVANFLRVVAATKQLIDKVLEAEVRLRYSGRLQPLRGGKQLHRETVLTQRPIVRGIKAGNELIESAKDARLIKVTSKHVKLITVTHTGHLSSIESGVCFTSSPPAHAPEWFSILKCQIKLMAFCFQFGEAIGYQCDIERRALKLPAFFKENTVFGEYPSVHFSDSIVVLPQIRPGANLSSLCVGPVIDFKTAKLEFWPLLMQEISGMREVGDNDNDSFCFKAHPLWPYRTPQSPATNAILMVRQRDSSDFSVDPAHTTEDSERQTPIYRTLTVGLVMNLTSDPLDSNEVHAQCKHFSAMFEHLSQATTQAVGIMTNVLVVCVLECSEGVMNLFGSDKTKLLEDYKHIQDVVLVDLTSSEGRAQFFGFDRRNKEGQLLVDTLEKTAGKIVEPRAKKKRKL
ncbi:Crinkler (CRN) family protein [Phytophthora cinnamomi]|uniref:Crinkler (CRN) family protein n=1 Tax=Phytophthora cinnamomi TaxID=4785 RepID=UPI0035596D05|nr:Crinkler (CRN) family protein [Phytophthora cinnamomi]